MKIRSIASAMILLAATAAPRFVPVQPELLSVGANFVNAWADYDGDGDLDLFVGFRDRPNAIFRNDGGRFKDVAAEIGLADPRKTVGAVWFDYDADGDLDLYVGNMDGDANGLFRNDGGRFTDVAAEAGVVWGGRTPRDPQNGAVRPAPRTSTTTANSISSWPTTERTASS